MSKSLFTTIIEEIAPTTETAGVVGQLYLDSVEKKLYQCVAITTETVDEVEVTSYTWKQISDELPNTIKVSGSGRASSNCDYGVVIGNGASASHGGNTDNSPIVLGRNAKVWNQTAAISIGDTAEAQGTGAIAIGRKAKSGNGAIVIGNNAEANAANTDEIAIGDYAKCYGDNIIQFGNSGSSSADHTGIGQINFGGPWNMGTGGNSFKTITLYNSTVNNTAGYHKLAFEEEVKPIFGEVDPSETTFGNLGQFYLNTITKTLFQCVNITSEIVEEVETFTYEWKEIGSSSSSESGTGNVDLTGYATEEYVNTSISNLVDSAPDTLNTLNELATAIQENDSVIDTLNSAITNKAEQTSLDAIINNEVQIGAESKSFKAANAASVSDFGIAIGNNAKAVWGIAIGELTEQSGAFSTTTCIGSGAKASVRNAMQLGTGTNSTENSLQFMTDNIYKQDTHTLTVQNISLNGTDINTVITNALPTLTSQLTNDSGYLTAADLNNSSVTVGETETTMEEIATMATNSIQIDDAATSDDIDALFEDVIPENIVQEGTDLNVASTDAEITQDGTNLDIGE